MINRTNSLQINQVLRSSHQPNGTFMSHRPVSITSRLVQLTDTCYWTGSYELTDTELTTGLELGELTTGQYD